MSKHAFGVLGVLLGFVIFQWVTWPTGVVRAAWAVEFENRPTIIVSLTESAVDVFRMARRAELSYGDPAGRFVSLPFALWGDEVDECAKKCQVERNGENIIIKFPFTRGAGASRYEFTPLKQSLE
jgi:hypothetical protein